MYAFLLTLFLQECCLNASFVMKFNKQIETTKNNYRLFVLKITCHHSKKCVLIIEANVFTNQVIPYHCKELK